MGYWANVGAKPSLPGQMLGSFELAERPNSGGALDAYVVFSMGGGGIILLGLRPYESELTTSEIRHRILSAKMLTLS